MIFYIRKCVNFDPILDVFGRVMARPAPLPPESAPGRHRVCHVKELRIIFMLTRALLLISYNSGFLSYLGLDHVKLG